MGWVCGCGCAREAAVAGGSVGFAIQFFDIQIQLQLAYAFQLTELLLGSFEINLICTDWIFNFGIFYAIPNWFSNISLELICLDLSSNLINSTLPNFQLMSGASINLCFNQFHGLVPLPCLVQRNCKEASKKKKKKKEEKFFSSFCSKNHFGVIILILLKK